MKVRVLCPSGSISGGPEALHQLAGALRSKGVDAAMVYYGNRDFREVPEPYWGYHVAVRPAAEDDAETVVVVPEVATSLVWRFQRAMKAVWWLSVDNYFKWRHINPGPSVLQPRDDVLHLCQSQYALRFLAEQGIGPLHMLTDYLTPGAFRTAPPEGRLPVIAYNPKKAPDALRRLMAGDGRLTWLKLEGLSKPALADLLREIQIYVDFGPHPGRDRIPREAALCGAVVITGRRGAAAHPDDVPLPDHFRLDESAPDFETRALALIEGLLRSESEFARAWTEQSSYREWIGRGLTTFMAEVDGFVAALAWCGLSNATAG